MSQRSSANSLGPTLLQIAFIVLKLTHVINWSWWWVMSPMWITASVAALLITVVVLKQAFEDKTNFR